MKSLVVEDDFTSRILLQEILKNFGTVHVAVNGKEAVEAFEFAFKDSEPYQLICIDLMMPEMDGHTALKKIRAIEEAHGILSSFGAKIIMTTALDDMKNVNTAYQNLCDAYLVKPIDKNRLLHELRSFGLI